MAKLFIANCTKQHQLFLYRIPGEQRASPYMQEIGIGKCVEVYRDDTADVLESIIAQHVDYGLVRVDEIDRTKDFIGMCYQFDKPIEADKIIRALDRNDIVLRDRGIEQRKDAAIAISDKAERDAEEAGGHLGGMEVTVEEVKVPGGSDVQINETIAVVKEGKRATGKRK